MKKTLLFAAAALTMLASCSQSDDLNNAPVVAESQNQAIEFGTYVGKTTQTRVTGGTTGDITTKTLQESAAGFGVIAYMKGTNGATDCYTTGTWNTQVPNFMYNQQVTWSTNHWTYTPVKFWPNDFATGDVDNKQGTGETDEANGSVNAGKVSFFAYAPYVAPNDYSTWSSTHKLNSTDNTAFDIYNGSAANDGIVAMTANTYNGEPQVKYVLSNASLTNAVDLLWGIRGTADYNLANNTTDSKVLAANLYNTDLTKQKVGETIDFNFKHALAKFGGNFYQADPEVKNSGVQIILDIDNGSANGGVSPSTAITGGVNEAATLVTVSDVKIEDIKTYADRTSNTSRGTTSDLITSGWFNIAKGEWTENTTTGATYNSTVSSSNTVGSEGYELNAAFKEGTVTYDTQWKIDGTARTGVTTTAQNLYTDDSNAPALLLIPSTTQAQTIIVTITYKVRTYDAKLSGNHWTEVEQTIANEVKLPANSLTSNKYYKLLIHLGLTSVKFSATVSDWESTTSGGSGGNANDDSANDKDIWLPSNTL